MGDLILAQVALEELGADPRSVDWLIERRSLPWALHVGLPHRCYDHRLLRTLSATAGTRRSVIDSEQRFGLSQALGLVAVGRGRHADRIRHESWLPVRKARRCVRLERHARNGRVPHALRRSAGHLGTPRRRGREPPPCAGSAAPRRRQRASESDKVAFRRAMGDLVDSWAAGRRFEIAAAPMRTGPSPMSCSGASGVARSAFAGDFDALLRQDRRRRGTLHRRRRASPHRVLLRRSDDRRIHQRAVRKWAPLAPGKPSDRP